MFMGGEFDEMSKGKRKAIKVYVDKFIDERVDELVKK